MIQEISDLYLVMTLSSVLLKSAPVSKFKSSSISSKLQKIKQGSCSALYITAKIFVGFHKKTRIVNRLHT